MAPKSSAAVQEADQEDGRRSRKKRPVYFYAFPADVEVQHVEMPGEDWSEARAKEALEKVSGKGCQILGPFYEVVGKTAEVETISVKISLRNMSFTGKRFEGSYNGWTFYANGVKKITIDGEQFADNDLLNVDFESLVDENVKTPKPRFGKNAALRRALLDDCHESKSA